MRVCHVRMLCPALGTLLASACTVAPLTTQAPADEPIAVVAAPVAPAAPAARREAPARPARMAVVVSDDVPEYQEIVDEILRRGAQGVTVHRLAGRIDNADRVLEQVGSSRPSGIIAVGLLAATVARRVPDVPMVFCQVYNYQDHDLLSAKSKGVQLLPPFDLQLQAWRRLGSAQSLRSIGVITGPGQEGLIAEIRQAVAPTGIALMVRTVEYDQGTALAFKELAPKIDGLWLLPDNRILSPDVVRKILTYSAKHSKQLVVFADSLLDMGALMSVSSVPSDVVDRVFARFADMDGAGQLRGPDMLRLTNMRMHVNAEVTKEFGQTVQEHLAHAR